MGKSSDKKKTCRLCGSGRCSISNEVCPKCFKGGQGNGKASRRNTKSSGKSSEANHKKHQAELNGRMDSKHFSSRSTTDNLPSSLSTPGERAGLTSPSSAAVDPASVATSSNSPNTISSHLPSTCGTSGPADITSHSANPTMSEAETDKRLPPDTVDSDLSLSSTSDKTYEPCSSNSGSSLSSSFSAVISSSSKGHDELTDFQGNGVSSTDNPCLSQAGKNSLNSSVPNSNGQSISSPTVGEIAKCVVPSSSNKDNLSASDRADDPIREGNPSTSSLAAKSHPVSGPQTSSSITLKDSKPSVEDQSPQSPLSKGVKRTHNEMEEQEEASPSPKPSPQKNKKRCFTCSCKLELAQRTIGKCRCERVFCPIHRLPELHHCEFNHKEDGRREAREKMVKPTRHMGTSFRRDDQT